MRNRKTSDALHTNELLTDIGRVPAKPTNTWSNSSMRISMMAVIMAFVAYNIVQMVPPDIDTQQQGESIATPAAKHPIQHPPIYYADIQNLTDSHIQGIASMRLDMFIHSLVENNKHFMKTLNTTCASPAMQLLITPPDPTSTKTTMWNILTMQISAKNVVTVYNPYISNSSADKTLFFTTMKFRSTRDSRSFHNKITVAHAYGHIDVSDKGTAFCIQEILQ